MSVGIAWCLWQPAPLPSPYMSVPARLVLPVIQPLGVRWQAARPRQLLAHGLRCSVWHWRVPEQCRWLTSRWPWNVRTKVTCKTVAHPGASHPGSQEVWFPEVRTGRERERCRRHCGSLTPAAASGELCRSQHAPSFWRESRGIFLAAEMPLCPCVLWKCGLRVAWGTTWAWGAAGSCSSSLPPNTATDTAFKSAV